MPNGWQQLTYVSAGRDANQRRLFSHLLDEKQLRAAEFFCGICATYVWVTCLSVRSANGTSMRQTDRRTDRQTDGL